MLWYIQKLKINLKLLYLTLIVASLAAQAVSWLGIPAAHHALQCGIRGAQGYCPVQGGGCNQSIGSTVSDAILRS